MKRGGFGLSESSPVDLSLYSSQDYYPGGKLKRALWYLVSVCFFESLMPWPSALKTTFLRMFGAAVGRGVVIKPAVKIKYPWFLSVGNHVWVGERAWIDNLAQVSLGDHSCISQEAYLLTGNHDYKDRKFGLRLGEIHVGAGAWVGAKSVVCPGLTVYAGAVLCAGSVAVKDLEQMVIYQGNPAQVVRKRVVRS